MYRLERWKLEAGLVVQVSSSINQKSEKVLFNRFMTLPFWNEWYDVKFFDTSSYKKNLNLLYIIWNFRSS